jgi:hypothetical protein
MLSDISVMAPERNTYEHQLRNLVSAAGAASFNDGAFSRSTV